MSLNLIKTVQTRFTDSTMTAIGGQLGLDPTTAKTGATALIPIILAAMVRIAAQQSGTDTLLETIRGGQHDGALVDRLPVMLASGNADEIPLQGSILIEKLLGPDAAAIITFESQRLGVKATALRALWLMLTPVVVDVIGGEIVAQHGGARGLRKRLLSSRNELATALPPEVAEQLGLGRPAAERGSNQAASSGKSSRLDFTFVIVFIVSAITFFFLAQYVLKPAQVDDAGQAAPQVPVD